MLSTEGTPLRCEKDVKTGAKTSVQMDIDDELDDMLRQELHGPGVQGTRAT